MAGTEFIVAIELGSSKITGMAGRKNGDGSVHVLACASEESSSFIKRGVIYNLNKTAQSLTNIINRLEAELQATIAQVYVGLGGQSLRTIKNTIVRRLQDENTITQELVDSINDENREVPLIDFTILDVAPQEYKIGNSYQIDPVGVFGNSIEGRFLNIIARSNVKNNLEKCFKQAGIEVVDYFIAPLALADVVLTDTEKRSGCALVDFGADTTTVSVYKNNILRHLTVLPIGSSSVTRDITNLKIEEPEAEQLKVNYGSAINELPKEGDEPYLISLQDKRTIEESFLNDIVQARTEEIIANVWNQIQTSGYETQLLAGVVFTGGGANLRRIEEAFRKKTKIDKIRQAKSICKEVKLEKVGLLDDCPPYHTVLGLLSAGELNCCKPEAPKPLTELFDEEIEVKSEEELERERKAEEERRREEEERKKKEKEKKKSLGKPSWLENLTKGLFDDNEMK